jgi:hypothetical protein
MDTMMAAKIPRPTPNPIASEDGSAFPGVTDVVGDGAAVIDILEENIAVDSLEATNEENGFEEAVDELAESVAIEKAGSANAAVVYIAASTVKARSGMLQHVVFVRPSLHSSGTTSPVLQHHLLFSAQPQTSWSSPGLLLCTIKHHQILYSSSFDEEFEELLTIAVIRARGVLPSLVRTSTSP